MKYTVIHSEDPWLLARMATELQMGGIDHDDYLFGAHPFNDICNFEWMAINHPESPINTFAFYNHSCGYNPTRHTLTSRNYLSILKKVLA